MSRPNSINKNFTPLIPYCWERNTSDTDTGVDPEAELKYRMEFNLMVECKPPAKPDEPNPYHDSTSPESMDDDDKFEGLFKCINAVECKGPECPLKSVDGDLNHPDYKPGPWGPGGKDPAIGPEQIHHGYWWDGHTPRPNGTDGMCFTCDTHRGCAENYACAKQIVKNYFKRYGRHGKPKNYDSVECLARIHNGGPGACSTPDGRAATDGYWDEIKNACLAGKCPCPDNVGRG